MIKRSLVIATAIASALLISCGGGGGGGGTPAERPAGSVGGKAVDAILIGSTIRAYEWKNGEIVSSVIDETVTGSDGSYALSPVYQDAYFILKATGGHYIEEATGTRVDLQSGQELTALVRYESGTALTTYVTVLTHFAACQAEWRAKTQGNNDADAVDLSNDLFSTVAGVPIRETEPLNITDPNNASPVLNAGLQYGLYPAGMSFLSKDLAEQSGQNPHTLTSTTTIHLAQIGCNDIRADGMLDGQGYTPATPNTISPLSFGTVQLDAATWRNDLAQKMLAAAASPINQTGLDASDFFNVADSLSQMDSSLFNNITPVSADISGPSVSLSTPENTFLKGNVLLDFEIEDPLGIKTLNFYVNDAFVSSGSEGNTSFSLDTTAYIDGLYEVKAITTDNADNETTFTRNFNFDNTGPTIELTSTLLTNQTSYQATGTFVVDGSPVNTITINGVSANVDTDAGTWNATIPLVSGSNTINMLVTDQLANEGTNERTVGVDLISPTISINNTTARFSAFDGQLNTCGLGDLNGSSASSTPVCVSTDNISLNGTTVDGNLDNLGFLALGYTVDDGQQSGVYSQRENLTVEYRFIQDGVEKVSWTTAPTINAAAPLQYLPMVTEYLGDDWHLIDRTINNRIDVRVCDEAGNCSSTDWNILVEVLIPALNVNSSMLNETLFTSNNFASRTSIDGQTVNVQYTFNNPSSITSFWINLDDAQDHSVAHTYETGIRKNRARIDTEEEWRGQFYYKFYNSAQAQETITSLERYTGDGWETITPPAPTTGTFEDVYSDTIADGNLGWIAQDRNSTCSPTYQERIANYPNGEFDVQYTLAKPGTRGGELLSLCTTTKQVVHWVNDWTAYPLLFEKRVTNTVVYETGYPRNEFNDTIINSDVLTESVKVYNDTAGREILPTSGWYQIPPNTSIRVVKAIRMPVLNHFNDTEVGNQDSFTSYAARNYDKSTTWVIDTDLEIDRVIAGSVADIPNATPTTESIGLGSRNYTISR